MGILSTAVLPGKETGDVPRVALKDMSTERFRTEFQAPRRPVVITDAEEILPMFMTPKYVLDTYGELKLPVNVGSTFQETMPLAFFLQLTQMHCECVMYEQDMPPEHQTVPPYLRNIHIAEYLKELIPHVQTPPAFMGPNHLSPEHFDALPPEQRARIPEGISKSWHHWAEFFLSGPGARCPYLHIDTCHTHAWSAQLFGYKQFMFYDPGQTELVYPTGSMGVVSQLPTNLDAADPAKFPKFAQAKQSTVILKAGEILFIPSQWWHTTKSLSLSITLGGNYVSDDVFEEFVADCARMETDAAGERREKEAARNAELFGKHMLTGDRQPACPCDFCAPTGEEEEEEEEGTETEGKIQ